jgi:hypothetical protein
MEGLMPKSVAAGQGLTADINTPAGDAADSAEPPQRPPEVPQPAAEPGARITKSQLVNQLNFINFQNESVQLHFVHRIYARPLTVPALPMPCLGEKLECRWAAPSDMAALSQSYELTHVIVPRGQTHIRVSPRLLSMDDTTVSLSLPEISHEISYRKAERHCGIGISVYLIQNSSLFAGTLLDFTASSFRVELKAAPPQTFEWIDPEMPVSVMFFACEQTFYAGECRILRHTQNHPERSYVLEPLKREIQRYRKTEYRSRRLQMTPSPNMVFQHPLTKKRVELKIVDLSGSGFSVEEDEDTAVLLPGLILPKIELVFADRAQIACSAQVVFSRRRPGRGAPHRLHCGLALIDIKASDHVTLHAMLHQLTHANTYICNELNLDALWDLFFETGFIYPGKYRQIERNKTAIRAMYERLYTRSPDIARHFVFQENGYIQGHMAMVRFWEDTWLIHHHAARKSAQTRAGLVVLDQIGRFAYESYRLSSLHMNYLVCCYRPENRFPHRVFGGVARHFNNPRNCSVDACAYVVLEDRGADAGRLPRGWTMETSSDADVNDLNYFYDDASGGILLEATDLRPASWRSDGLSAEYRNHGFRRERHCYVLRNGGVLKAFAVAQISDIGLNLSELTNCITVFAIQPQGLTAEILTAFIRSALTAAGQSNVPALIFPLSAVQQNATPFEKTYHFWTLRIAGQSDTYFRYFSRLMTHV